MKVICYGDSNTYGYDPRSYFGGRYDSDHRWTDILARRTGWNVENQGMNGREIPAAPVRFPKDTDLLIIMLGTNDLLQGRGVEITVKRMEQFLLNTGLEREKMLLIAPPPMSEGAWVTDSRLVKNSHSLADAYKRLALTMGIYFANAGDWDISLAFDGVHFTEDGHSAFARGLFLQLTGGSFSS